jgi:tetratricopeptide (TPR) repeat protein
MADFYINDLKEPAQAAVKLRQILEIDHDNLETYDRLIAIELSQKHYHEASCALESLLEIENLSEDRALKAKAQLAELYVEKLHRSRQAIPLLEDLLAKSPDDTRSLHLLSMVYFDEAKYEESLNICLKLNACLNAPENISILLQMATIYKILNNTPKIAETLNEAVEVNEDLSGGWKKATENCSKEELDELHTWMRRD